MKPDIGEPLFITDVYRELRKVESIIDVVDVKVHQITGFQSTRDYSEIVFDVDAAMSADERFIEVPKNVIYEIRYPAFDIDGVII